MAPEPLQALCASDATIAVGAITALIQTLGAHGFGLGGCWALGPYGDPETDTDINIASIILKDDSVASLGMRQTTRCS